MVASGKRTVYGWAYLETSRIEAPIQPKMMTWLGECTTPLCRSIRRKGEGSVEASSLRIPAREGSVGRETKVLSWTRESSGGVYEDTLTTAATVAEKSSAEAGSASVDLEVDVFAREGVESGSVESTTSAALLTIVRAIGVGAAAASELTC